MSGAILILGAGLMQKPAILSAKNLGLKVYVVDANPSAVSVPLADVFSPIDLKDKEAIAEYAKTIPELKGIFTAGTDFSASVSYAAEKCGLPAHSYEASLNASVKSRMRECFRKNMVPSPAFTVISRNEITDVLTPEYVSKLNFPCVVKPVDNMGARGCRMIRSKEELIYSVTEAIKNSRTDTAILEEYMEGPEFSIDAVLYNGTFTVTGFADRHIYYPPYFIEMGHTMPTNIAVDQYKLLVKAFACGAKALGLTTGVAKADIKWTSKGPMIGEIAARLSGGYMSGWTFPYSSDLNLTEQAILVSMGKAPLALEKCRMKIEMNGQLPYELYGTLCDKTSAERAWLSIPGRVKKIYGMDEAFKLSEICDVLPRVQEGDAVSFPRNNVEKCGNVISLHEKASVAVHKAEEAVSMITLCLENNNPETERFLKGITENTEDRFPPDAYQLPESVLRELEDELSRVEQCIPQGKSLDGYIPEAINKPEIFELQDWNHLSLSKAIEKFNKIGLNHKEVDYKKFWLYFVRGGIQGALYAAEV